MLCHGTLLLNPSHLVMWPFCLLPAFSESSIGGLTRFRTLIDSSHSALSQLRISCPCLLFFAHGLISLWILWQTYPIHWKLLQLWWSLPGFPSPCTSSGLPTFTNNGLLRLRRNFSTPTVVIRNKYPLPEWHRSITSLNYRNIFNILSY